MKHTFLTILLSIITLTSYAQSDKDDQVALSTYIAANFSVPSKAMAYSDMPELLENATIMLNVELAPNGTINNVNVNQGIDELFDNTLRTFVYLMPKNVCAPMKSGEKRMVNVALRVNLKPLPLEVARLLEMRTKRRFMKIKVSEELCRQVPEVKPYIDQQGSSLWIMRSRAYQLVFSPTTLE